jgi:predicted AlkP superfamily phosphohydrolase/phosphomutase
VARKGAVCRYLVERNQPDLMVICFGESHTAAHQFWKASKETVTGRSPEAQRLSHAIRDVYQQVDKEIGLLLRDLPSSTNVFVLSSIGLTDHYPTGELMEAFCRKLGYQAQPEKQKQPFHPMSLARRLIPEKWRLRLSRRLTRERRERLFAQQFRNSVNWRETTAFSIPSIYTGFIRINLRGREPEGIVDPAEYLTLLGRIEDDLAQVIDPKTGERAIERVVRTIDLYPGNYPETLPDLIVQWKSCTHFVDRVIHPRAELFQKKPEFFRDSEHTDRGFFAAAGPAIRARGRLADVDVLDLAPTFLDLLGKRPPDQMPGRVMTELFEDQARAHAS